MASILRQIVAGPRIRHEETGLDLVYVTDNIIAMSMPAAEYPKMAYRNPIHKVVEFLDKKHGDNWAVWEFRAEGTGYDDKTFHDRVFHSPWPDHHPPPFGLIPNIMASMRNHLKKDPQHVAVVHCKAGKGRTGTVTCSYLISEEGWSREDALERFTKKRMRPQFGAGVSIPSQLRYIHYVTDWVSPKYNRTYIERSVKVTEIHIWGLREGAKLSIIGYVNEGKVMKVFHTLTKEEKTIVDEKTDTQSEVCILRPNHDVILPTNDICIDFERRSKATYGWTFVWTSVFLPIVHFILTYFNNRADADRYVRKQVSALAHVWFNAYFEGDSQSGVFTQEWDGMDGLRGTHKKGSRIFDKLQVVWQVVEQEKEIHEPGEDEPVAGTQPVDETQIPQGAVEDPRNLGLRPSHPGDVDLASMNSQMLEPEDDNTGNNTEDEELETTAHPLMTEAHASRDVHSLPSISTDVSHALSSSSSSSPSHPLSSATALPSATSSSHQHVVSPLHQVSMPMSPSSEPVRDARKVTIGTPVKVNTDPQIS